MGLIRWLLAIVILAGWAALIGTSLYVAMYDQPEDIPEAQAIVVLGASMSDAGEPRGETLERIATAATLYENGRAPVVVLSGGAEGLGSDVVAQNMVAAAVEAGIPEDAIQTESNSQSTLQNALFTADLPSIDRADPIILVTHRYHQPRAWASFRWAGFGNIAAMAAPDAQGPFELTEGLLWETVKWPYNVARAAAASAAIAGDVPRENFVQYLQ